MWRVIYSAVHAVCSDRHGFEPRTSLMLADMFASKYVDRKDLAAMLTSIQSADVAPEVNLRITQVRKHAKRDPHWL